MYKLFIIILVFYQKLSFIECQWEPIDHQLSRKPYLDQSWQPNILPSFDFDVQQLRINQNQKEVDKQSNHDLIVDFESKNIQTPKLKTHPQIDKQFNKDTINQGPQLNDTAVDSSSPSAAIETKSILVQPTISGLNNESILKEAKKSDPKGKYFIKSPLKSDHEPGSVLAYRSVELNIASYPVATPYNSYQLIYKSANTKGVQIDNIVTLIIPQETDQQLNRPLIVYQPIINGLSNRCSPSSTLLDKSPWLIFDGLHQREVVDILTFIKKGWIIVVTDHQGDNAAFMAGQLAGRLILDAIRASTLFLDLKQDTMIALFGYSGGAHSTLWAAEMQPSYAPEIKLTAIVAGGVPYDLANVTANMSGTSMAGIGFAGQIGLLREYPEVDIMSMLNEEGRKIVKTVEDKCAIDMGISLYNQRLEKFTDLKSLDEVPEFARILTELTLGKGTPTAPVYLFHSYSDEYSLIEDIFKLIKSYCKSGVKVEFAGVEDSLHFMTSYKGFDGAIRFIEDRFQGIPFDNDTCKKSMNSIKI